MDEHYDPAEPWLQQPEESIMWYSRFCLYLELGPSRTFLGALNAYERQNHKKESKSLPGAWTQQARDFQWKFRAEAYDKVQLARRRKQIEEEQEEVYSTGLGLAHRRVKVLKEITDRLVEITQKDLKKGYIAPRQHEILLQYIDMIADQKGDKKIKQEIGGTAGNPIQVQVFVPEPEEDKFEELSDDEI